MSLTYQSEYGNILNVIIFGYFLILNMLPRKIEFFTTSNNRCPFSKWHEKLDKKNKHIVTRKLIQVEKGNLGDHSSITKHHGLHEFRLNKFRVYFTMKCDLIVIFNGGIKDNQDRDIAIAGKYLQEYNNG